MPVPDSFSADAGDSDWVGQLEAWVRSAAALGPTTPLRVARVRPWSIILTASNGADRVWCKVLCPAQDFEPALHAALAQRHPAHISAPLAIGQHPARVLSRDHGVPQAERGPATAERWRELLTGVARLQRSLIPARAELLALGLPDHRPATVPDHARDLLALLRRQPGTATWAPSAAMLAALESRLPAIAEASAVLAADGPSATWQHGDLHPGNVVARKGRLELFDFGDGQWASPLEVLCVPHDVLCRPEGPAHFSEVIDGYLAVWDLSPEQFGALWPSVRICHAVNRSLTWWRCLQTASPEELTTWAPQALQPLATLLQLTEPGSSRT